jgi:uncharacterized lipoprotein YehR (DUF1307 family)
MEATMKLLKRWVMIPIVVFAISACGDKKDSAQRNLEAQKAIQEGMQKEKQMYEGVQKGVENLEKKMGEQETKK